MSDVVPAPSVVLRAAVWPIELLSGFGQERVSRAAYDRALASERARLWSVTAGDPAFLKALTLANPALAERVAAADWLSARRRRRLEHVLFRYLSRAVGRTEPCDVWAGVELATWSPQTRIRPTRPEYRCAPDLRPFQALLRELARRPAYRASARWRPNATLRRRDGGGWDYVARLPDGSTVRRLTVANPPSDELIARLPTRALRLDEIALELHRSTHLPLDRLITLLVSYAHAGIIVGGLDLPSRFTTPWDALARAEQDLHGADRRAWSAAVAGLRRGSRELEQRMDELSPHDVAAVLRAAVDEIVVLAGELRADVPPLPRTVLRCDLRLPWRVALGPELRGTLLATVQEYEAYRHEGSPASALRYDIARRVADRIAPAARVPDLAGLAQFAGAGWSPATLEAGAAAPRSGLPQPDGAQRSAPLGCLIAGLVTGQAGDLVAEVRGVFDEVAPIYARYAPLFGPVHPNPADPLYTWLRDALDRVGRQAGVGIVELVGPCEINPNALAGPALTSATAELWGAAEESTPMSEAIVVVEPDGALLVRAPFWEEPVALFSFAAADIARGDDTSALLLRTSFREGPVPHFFGSTLTDDAELQAGAPSTAVRLPGGAVLRPRRTLLTGGPLRRLLDLPQAQRYAEWQRLARSHCWPALVRMRAGTAPALLVPTNSPLALESVLDRVSARTSVLAIEEPAGTPWLTDEHGQHFMAELAIPFRRSMHAWLGRADRASMGAAERRPVAT